MPVEWISEEKCRKMIGPGVYGHLATAGTDNIPYITPVNYVYVDDCIYIHTGFSGRKIKNIEENGHVCFEISSAGNLYGKEEACSFTMRFWSILIEGTASFTADREVKKNILEAFMKKYAAGLDYRPVADEEADRVNIIKISPEKMTGKLSLDPQE